MFNAPLDKFRDGMIADVLLKQRWTAEEFGAAESEIYNNYELSKEISYSGAITPALFSKARESMRTVTAKGGTCDRCGERKEVTIKNHPQAGDYCGKCFDEL